tara:strand:- start:88 stop:624 length:537 start_codon:yes stop_codon:yes gene_type:complete
MQHSLFALSLDEPQHLRASTKSFDVVDDAKGLVLGVQALFYDLGYCAITEMRLSSGRRVDVIGLDRRGRFAVAEIKTNLADLRSDQKWPEYLAFCDRFYFAVPVNFPIEIVPTETGLIVADQFGGEILRPSQHHIMTMGRRNRQIMQFARTAGMRLRKYDRQSGVLGRQMNAEGSSGH